MSTSTNGSGNHNRLATELRNQLTSLLSGCLEELDKLARNPEFRSSPTCTNIYQRYDALDAFIGARERIGTEYPQEVASGFYLVLHQNTVASVDSDPHSLELVDADEFEINIAMTRIAQKAEEVHKETLCQIELRLEELGMLQAHRVYPFCLHPSSLYYPFQNAVLPLEIDVQAKVLLCQLFEQRLSPKLLSFYKQINQLLIDHGLLANDKRLRQAIGVRDRVETSTLAPHMRNLPFGGLSTGEFFAPTELRRWDSEAAPASASTTNYEADAPSHIDLIDEDSLTALQWYLNPNFTPKSMGYALGPIIQARPTNRQVVQALSFVQHTNVPDQEPIDAQTIKNKLNDKLAEIKAKTGELAGSQLRITESEEKIIDFVHQIFKTIFDDAVLSDAVKALLFRLQIPVIKLALLEFAFFQNAHHPARRLLNELVSLGMTIDDKHEPLFNKLDSIVDGVINNFATDTLPFEEALKQLQTIDYLASEQAREIEQETLSAAKVKAQRSAAKRKVIAILKRAMKARKMPNCAMDFILKCWAPYMGIICLKYGLQSKLWDQAVLVLHQIVEASQPERTPAEIGQILGTQNYFFNRIQKQLNNTGWHFESQQRMLAHAREWLQNLVEHAASSAPEADNTTLKATLSSTTEGTIQPIRQQLVFTATTPAEDETEGKLQDLIDSIPMEVKPGAWFEIFRGENRAKRRLKLSTILEETGQLLFADRKGYGVLEVELESFLQDLREGRTKLIDDNNRFDRALSAVISTIRANQEKYSGLSVTC